MTGAGFDATAGARPEFARQHGSWLDTGITLVVALVAAGVSYGHMLEVALWAGEPLWLARAFPITVDGLVYAALRRGPEGRPWLLLGIAVSVAANVLARFPEAAVTAGPVVSAWPPLALYGTHRILRGRHAQTVTQAAGGVQLDDAAPSSSSAGAGDPDGGVPARRRRGPAPTNRPGPARQRSERRRAPAGEVTELLPAGRRVAARLAADGLGVTRDAIAAGLRAEGVSVSNADAGRVAALLRDESRRVPAPRALGPAGNGSSIEGVGL